MLFEGWGGVSKGYYSSLVCMNACYPPLQESFTLEKYVEKLAQLNPETGLGPLHKNKDKSKPFDPEVQEHVVSYICT